MPGLHGADLVVVLVVALLVFGPKRLPEMGSAIGKTFQEFKKSMNEISESVKADVKKSDAPAQLTAAEPAKVNDAQ